ncbi:MULTISPECIES: DUF1491 family protein [unclassified Sphingomonas]|uniref:DUF1491 family protein n=1 Tax=unclassified Sphingomonas TaxID=196159 RepID=UPI0006FA687E|nr:MULTISPECIES: DUF1491 family protein [unclassified Sphingomonas]KQX21540.1 hypothetical protein ASD17_06180 [Sphingomonas sp. Root1294]KQY72857.1 hypothetical protein ASD39_00165 [Sphingomonas sp. Root50]KRB88349.1 hypothetical protein ASE22_23275 [Sphingomonas sp. Root720]
MIEPRAATGLLVSALIRRIEAEGGSAMVIGKGDAIAGAVLVMLADRGVLNAIVERVWRFDGGHGFEKVGPADPNAPGAAGDYVARRRRSDPDLWVVEIDHREAERIAGEVLL